MWWEKERQALTRVMVHHQKKKDKIDKERTEGASETEKEMRRTSTREKIKLEHLKKKNDKRKTLRIVCKIFYSLLCDKQRCFASFNFTFYDRIKKKLSLSMMGSKTVTSCGRIKRTIIFHDQHKQISLSIAGSKITWIGIQKTFTFHFRLKKNL